MNKAYNRDILDWDSFPDYDIICCDPPWEQKMVNYFETLMFKSGQIKPQNTIIDILQKLAKLSHKNKPVFIEYSIKGYKKVIDTMVNEGHLFYSCVESLQENGKPYCILVLNSIDFEPDGTKQGFNIIDFTCDNFKFKTVFDPFAGIGKTAKRFIKNNKTYIGSEINTQRLNKLKEVLWAEQQ